MKKGLEFKELKEIKKMQERCMKVMMEIDRQRSECLNLMISLEEKRNELEEYIRERGE